MPIANLKFVEAYRAAHSAQAHVLRFALEEAGIRVIIENDAIGDFPCGWSSGPRLMVEESQLAAARAIISQTDHSERANPKLSPRETTIAMTAACSGLVDIAAIAKFAAGALAHDSAIIPEKVETTRCLDCDAVMPDAESTCPKCGWSYEPDDSAELL